MTEGGEVEPGDAAGSADGARFRTKTGHVLVTAEQLVIERTGARGGAARLLQGNSKPRTLVIYGLLFGWLVWTGWTSLRSELYLSTTMFWSIAAWIAWSLVKARSFTMAPIVVRSDTSRVEGVTGVTGATRDRLVVHLTENGRDAQRFILMPGVLQNGGGELGRALSLLTEHGWPVDRGPES